LRYRQTKTSATGFRTEIPLSSGMPSRQFTILALDFSGIAEDEFSHLTRGG
jgi:hypothetical protein